MFTLFHALGCAGLVAGCLMGARFGAATYGLAGGIGGAVAGGVMGLMVARIPELLALSWVARDLRRQSTADLQAYLHNPECLTPNCVLLELQRRGVDIREELPVVLEMLASEDVNTRSRGWTALNSAYPGLEESIPDYRITDSADDCRRKLTPLTRLTTAE